MRPVKPISFKFTALRVRVERPTTAKNTTTEFETMTECVEFKTKTKPFKTETKTAIFSLKKDQDRCFGII